MLSIIPLINNRKNLFSSEASLKYFLTQALASSILLFSVLIIISKEKLYRNTGYESYSTIILNSSLLTKMGAAPFHFWFPEVIEGLDWINSIILLTWQKIAPIILLINNINPVKFLRIIIIFCMVVRGIIGLNQTSLRKILAYSSINHMGWIIASIIIMESIWSYYFSIYSIISLNLILMFKYLNIYHVTQLITSINQIPIFKIAFVLNFFSLGGLPPFLGFLPKWITIQTIVENQLYLLTVRIIVITLLTLYYYLRISFRSLTLRRFEINYLISLKTPVKSSLILLFNSLAILSLILCTLIFNWI